MTSEILFGCVSKKQKEAIINVLGLKNSYKPKSINTSIDDIQNCIATYYVGCEKRNCCDHTNYLFNITLCDSFIFLSKYYDFKTKTHNKKINYKINTNGIVEII